MILFWDDLSLWSAAAVRALEESGFTCSHLLYIAILITLPVPEWNSIFFPPNNQFLGDEKPCRIVDGCPRASCSHHGFGKGGMKPQKPMEKGDVRRESSFSIN